MKRYAFFAVTAVVGGAVAFQGSVNLQDTTPGTAQTGHLNITGTAKAGAVVGYSSAPTGIAYGGDFRSASTSGRGILGNASATTGATYGGLFQSFSNGGRGVAGIAQSATGTTYGGFFSSLSNQGRGVYGQATAASGTTYGVYGTATSPNGYGVYSDGNMAASGSIFAPLASFISSSANQPLLAQNLASTSGASAIKGIASATTGATNGGYFASVSANGRGVYGYSPNTGVYGEGSDGVRGLGGYRGVMGTVGTTGGVNYGVWGQTDSTTGIGTFGYATATSGQNFGVYGHSSSTGGRGVYGVANASSGLTIGVWGASNSTQGSGVWGENTATSGSNQGVYGLSRSGDGFGVYGHNTTGVGVLGSTNGTSPETRNGVQGVGNGTGSNGVLGRANTDFGVGVVGISLVGDNGLGVECLGDLLVSGEKMFRIDHPFDPENKYLIHYCSESPMPQNFYVGNVVTDAKGYAWVELPDYFAEINKNFKYQLTIIDDADADGFVQVKVSKKIKDRHFQIRTSSPNTEVSWRVDADRNDLWVRSRPPKDVVDKVGSEKGTYQVPKLYGLGPERGLFYDQPRAKKVIKQAK